MIRLAILAAALVLTACGPKPSIPMIPAAPVEAADLTTLDEQGAIGAEVAYAAARTALETAVDAGMIQPGSAWGDWVAELDMRAYAALQGVRGAYRAGNAASYAKAIAEARTAIDAFKQAVKGTGQ